MLVTGREHKGLLGCRELLLLDLGAASAEMFTLQKKKKRTKTHTELTEYPTICAILCVYVRLQQKVQKKKKRAERESVARRPRSQDSGFGY